jgi:hypothetical protein
MSKLSKNAINYTIQQLLHIVGINQIQEIRINISSDSLSLSFENKHIVFKLMNAADTEELFKGELKLKRIPSFDSKVNVPIFFTNDNTNFASIEGEEMIINADIITLSFIMLSRYEETLVEERDQYIRFEYKNSLACKYDFIDIPIVDEYAKLLMLWLLRFMPTLEIYKHKGRVIPTHDIDSIRRFGNLFRNIETIIGGDIITRKSLTIAFKSLKQCIATATDTKNDPLILAIKHFIAISKAAGIYSIFYFKGLIKGQKDCTYDVFIPEVKHCMDTIKDAGMIVGMHGGYDSYNNDKILKQEKEKIELVYGGIINTNRQHFLRFDINKTIQVWQSCSLQNDSTLGYAEREGFRCGTCHEYYLFDLKNDCLSTVKERPLIVMEGTLFEYRGKNIESALSIIEKLYDRCQAVGGDFVILWHNGTVFRDYEDKFTKVYCEFIKNVL